MVKYEKTSARPIPEGARYFAFAEVADFNEALKTDVVLVINKDNTRCWMEIDNKKVSADFTHTDSVVAWLQGYNQKYMEGQNTQSTEIRVVRTGNTFHLFLKDSQGKWHRVEHPDLPAFSSEKALGVGLLITGGREFTVSQEDRTVGLASNGG